MKYLKWIRPIGCKLNYFVIVKKKMPQLRAILKLDFIKTSSNNIFFNFFKKNLTFLHMCGIIDFTNQKKKKKEVNNMINMITIDNKHKKSKKQLNFNSNTANKNHSLIIPGALEHWSKYAYRL